ncbi:hypothetical protein NC653_015019 [Populus alba x Populus x berolinensis]|uniref:Uncharacterized protein n=1 Tax=Populus alba x Populus x berolinensis TaxID=444605 RepID=A0AAD6QYL8_9ROSI|nr:hypothetical protein NC653_015019 [Populus alba x Populus x berolinensis]
MCNPVSVNQLYVSGTTGIKKKKKKERKGHDIHKCSSACGPLYLQCRNRSHWFERDSSAACQPHGSPPK